MNEWNRIIQSAVLELESCIREKQDDQITLQQLAKKYGYSEYHFSRKFREVSGMRFREYLRQRRLSLALKALRDTDRRILEIALDYGFSSHEAFTRAFEELYGIAPSVYRRNPRPVALRTILKPFDCYLMEQCPCRKAEQIEPKDTENAIKTYFVTIPAHQFLHIRNYESIGYWDFWERQSRIPGQDCDTICGLLESIPGKLDDAGGKEADSGSGQIMGFLNEPSGRICSWGIPLAECYGVRLPMEYHGPVPEQMILMEIPEGTYLVFEHGPFDFESENRMVEAKMERAMKDFDYVGNGYCLDTTPGRIFYFYHDCTRFWKYVRPVRKIGDCND